jgi:hypothetical protein
MNRGETRVRRAGMAQLQSWMQTVITDADGIGAGVASVEACAALDVNFASLEEIVTRSATLSGAERLAIYSRSYHTRLLECFRQMFPALLFALDQELFDSFALDYLQHYPSNSYTLNHLADNFPRHLAATRPDADAPDGEREQWPDFIIELATLELAFLKIFDGDGLEGRALPDVRRLQVLPCERLFDARPAPAPCLRLFAFNYPIHAYLIAARRGEKPELPAPAETFVAASRRRYQVQFHELSAAQYALLAAFDGKRSVGEVLARGVFNGDGTQDFADTVRLWLCAWTTAGFFESVEL